MSFTFTNTEAEPQWLSSPCLKARREDLLLNPKPEYHEKDGAPIKSPPQEQIAFEPGHILLHHEAEVEVNAEDEASKKVEESIKPAEVARLAPITTKGTSTPPIAIGSSPFASRSQSRARTQNAEEMARVLPGANEVLKAKSRRKRKKRAAQKNAPAPPALSTVRGFPGSLNPTTDEDSDFVSTVWKRKQISVDSSLANSPRVIPLARPDSAQRGLSALGQRLDELNLNEPRGRTKMEQGTEGQTAEGSTNAISGPTSDYTSDAERPEMVSYEVPLDQDFVSDETKHQHEDPLSPCFAPEDVHRKMTATDFEPLMCLGKGTFGTVLLVRQIATGRLYAQKTFRKASLTVQKTLVEQTKSERAILESINQHPFIVSLHYAFQDHAKLYLVLDYAQGGELFTHLADARLFPEPTVAFYLAELVLALAHLHHEVGVVYRDLKPENCLLDAQGHLLLTDFGLSKVAVGDSEGGCRSILGTVEYMAPEVLRGVSYGTAVDWWSLGALGFDLLTGDPPFCGGNHAAIQAKILRSKPQMPHFLGPDAKDFLTRLLRKDPGKRLGGVMPRDLPSIKGHRFFRKIDWKKLERKEIEPPIQPKITDPARGENFAAEFTGLPLSPVTGAHEAFEAMEEHDPFGGFSYVASRSLLNFEA